MSGSASGSSASVPASLPRPPPSLPTNKIQDNPSDRIIYELKSKVFFLETNNQKLNKELSEIRSKAQPQPKAVAIPTVMETCKFCTMNLPQTYIVSEDNHKYCVGCYGNPYFRFQILGKKYVIRGNKEETEKATAYILNIIEGVSTTMAYSFAAVGAVAQNRIHVVKSFLHLHDEELTNIMLLSAVQYDRTNMAKLLIEHGADIQYSNGTYIHTTLMMAAEKMKTSRDPSMMRILMDTKCIHPITPSKRPANTQDTDTDTDIIELMPPSKEAKTANATENKTEVDTVVNVIV